MFLKLKQINCLCDVRLFFKIYDHLGLKNINYIHISRMIQVIYLILFNFIMIKSHFKKCIQIFVMLFCNFLNSFFKK